MVGGPWAGSCEQAGSFISDAMLLGLAKYQDRCNGKGRFAAVKITQSSLLCWPGTASCDSRCLC